MTPSELMVRLGESNMNSTHASPSRRDVAVSKIFKHEGYDEKTFINDIAILQLKEKMDWNKLIRPICLPTAAAALNLEGNMATVAGIFTFFLYHITYNFIALMFKSRLGT